MLNILAFENLGPSIILRGIFRVFENVYQAQKHLSEQASEALYSLLINVFTDINSVL